MERWSSDKERKLLLPAEAILKKASWMSLFRTTCHTADCETPKFSEFVRYQSIPALQVTIDRLTSEPQPKSVAQARSKKFFRRCFFFFLINWNWVTFNHSPFRHWAKWTWLFHVCEVSKYFMYGKVILRAERSRTWFVALRLLTHNIICDNWRPVTKLVGAKRVRIRHLIYVIREEPLCQLIKLRNWSLFIPGGEGRRILDLSW